MTAKHDFFRTLKTGQRIIAIQEEVIKSKTQMSPCQNSTLLSILVHSIYAFNYSVLQ